MLGIGEEAAAAGGKLRLLRLVSDSRCPKDAQCIWAGEVTLAFRFTDAGGAREFELAQQRNPTASVGEHSFTLADFGPCPAGHAKSDAGCASVSMSPANLR